MEGRQGSRQSHLDCPPAVVGVQGGDWDDPGLSGRVAAATTLHGGRGAAGIRVRVNVTVGRLGLLLLLGVTALVARTRSVVERLIGGGGAGALGELSRVANLSIEVLQTINREENRNLLVLDHVGQDIPKDDNRVLLQSTRRDLVVQLSGKHPLHVVSSIGNNCPVTDTLVSINLL